MASWPWSWSSSRARRWRTASDAAPSPRPMRSPWRAPVDAETGVDVWALPLEGERKPVEVLRTSFNEQHAQFSPDRRWVAYESDRTGRFEIYVRPFARPDAELTVSSEGGSQARWNDAGDELFYIAADDRLMAVPLRATAAGPGLERGAPRALFQTIVGSTAPNTNRQQYMVSPDGKSFVMNSLLQRPAASPIRLILNWPSPGK